MKLTCRFFAAAIERAALLGEALAITTPAGRHLAGCPHCRRLSVEQTQACAALAGAWSAPTPSPDFVAQTWQRISAAEGRRPTLSRSPLILAWLAVPALGAALAWVLLHPQPRAPQLAHSPTPKTERSASLPPLKGRAASPGGPDVPSQEPAPGAESPQWKRPLPSPAGAEKAPAAPTTVPDERYFDGRDASLQEHWLAGATPMALPKLSRVKDDFVEVPLPNFAEAANDPKLIQKAVSGYEEEAKIVDPRLFRKVSLRFKAGSLQELCDELTKQSEVTLNASRGVQDEKVTLFIKDLPARDVMRAVARLLGFTWTRSGAEGAYQYELTQTLRARLAEEELRNQDLNAALLALDEEMKAFAPYLGMNFGQLQARLRTARSPEKERLEMMIEHGGWGAVQAYAALSPADRLSLVSGGDLTLTREAANPDRRIPTGWTTPMLQSYPKPFTFQTRMISGLLHGEPLIEGAGDQRLATTPGATPKSLGLKVNRSELGELSLQSQTWIDVPFDGNSGPGWGIPFSNSLGTGRSPSAANPDNARLNAESRKDPALQPLVTLKSEPAKRIPVRLPEAYQNRDQGPRITTAEFWQEVHDKTGLNVVADFYTRLYTPASGSAEKVPLFDALCRCGDGLGLRWKKDGGLVMARSTTYFWDKLKEVPKRHLERWRAHREEKDGLPMDDLLEISTLPDGALDSGRVGEGSVYLWGLAEWEIVGRTVPRIIAGYTEPGRAFCRYAAGLNTFQRQKALTAQGLGFGELSQEQKAGFVRLIPEDWLTPQDAPALLAGAKVRLVYSPAGWYSWSMHPFGTRYPFAADRTADLALTAARRLDPSAEADRVQLSPGELLLNLTLADGSVVDAARLGANSEHAPRR